MPVSLPPLPSLFLLLLLSLPLASSVPPPNFVIVLTDDQGWGDYGMNCDNTTALCALTPNIDALMTSPHTALFHRFYSGAGVCSPTRGALLTGRSNLRDCIVTALPCDTENPAPTCAMGAGGALPTTEFTIADAAKKTTLGSYATAFFGKWHLGDLWHKDLPNLNPHWPVSSPGNHGFDEWMATQAEASSSMSNCGCFPVNHTHVGPQPPSGYPDIIPHGDACVVGGGFPSDWCYPCTDYYYPNASDARQVHELTTKVPGDDSEFLMGLFDAFVGRQAQASKPFLVELSLHSIHEPHPAMPEYYSLYKNDPDYLGTLTQMDVQFGNLTAILKKYNVYNNTMIIYTSDNGPHQGAERTDIRYSTGFLRQCKDSVWEGGIRVPGLVHAPFLINKFTNVTTPVCTMDILPTIMDILNVTSDNPTWIMDGMSFLPFVTGNSSQLRPNPIMFAWNTQKAIIDNSMKLIQQPSFGQCDPQEPYKSVAKLDEYYLYDLSSDYHEARDLKSSLPSEFSRLKSQLDAFAASLNYSQIHETGCRLTGGEVVLP